MRDWRTYVAGEGESWFGFEAVRALHHLPPEILLVPLAGHTWGHSGVAVRGPHSWLLHAGDAYFHHDEIAAPHYRCPAGLRAYQRLMEVDRRARITNQQRLRTLVRQQRGVQVICGHDRAEFMACCGDEGLPLGVDAAAAA